MPRRRNKNPQNQQNQRSPQDSQSPQNAPKTPNSQSPQNPQAPQGQQGRRPPQNRQSRQPRQNAQNPQNSNKLSQDHRRRRQQNKAPHTFRPPPSIPIPTNKGIKARSQRGNFSRNWWAIRWIEAMERLVDPHRLQRGRSYARDGQVLSIQETQYGVEAKVQGSRTQPYKVTIQVTHLTDEAWEQVVDAMAEQALFTAQLLAGEMPENIEDAFQVAGVSLFPDKAGDLITDCSCPDWANPCKHVAASHYILGDRFDDDPFLLFRMRGRSQEQILEGLRARRTGESELDQEDDYEDVESEQSVPLEALIDTFWEPAESLDNFPLTIRTPTFDMPMLKRLDDPAFIIGESLQSILKPVYDIFTRSALRAAYSEEEPLESNNGKE